MADDLVVTTDKSGYATTAPDGTVFRLDSVGGKLVQIVKLDVGVEGESERVTSLARETGGNLDLILAKLSADPATETTLSALLDKVLAAPSTEAKQDAIITLLIAIASDTSGLEGKDYATQGTLAALLAVDEAKLDAIISGLAAIDGHVDGLEAKDYATQTTLAAILAKLLAAPATEAKQDAGNTLLTTLDAKDFATQTTLAALLAKVIAAPSTEAKQDATNTLLTAIAGYVDGVETALGLLAKLTDTQPVSAAALPLPAGASTETTSAAILAKLLAAPATEAKQDTIVAALGTIDGHVDGLEGKDYATQATLASLLAKVSGDQATQTTLAALLAKVISAPSTEAKQDAAIALLTAIAGYVDGVESALGLLARLTDTQPVSLASVPSHAVTGPLTDTQLRAAEVPVSAASLPLPSGASTETTLAALLAKTLAAPATEAKQDTLKTAVDAVATAVGLTTKPADQQHVVVDSGIPVGLTDVQLRAAAVPVSGPATDTQLRASPLPVSAAALPLPAGAAQETGGNLDAILAKIIATPSTEATLALIKAKTDNLDVALSTRTKPADAQTVSGTVATTSAAASQADGHSVAIGATADADTALTVIGRLKKLVALFAAGLPAALGAGGGLKVDGSGTALPVSLASVPSHAVTNAGTFAVQSTSTSATTSTVTNVAASATNVTLLAANAARRGATFYNDSTVNLTLKHGATASATSRTLVLQPGGTYELPLPVYPGIIDGLWASATGSCAVTETV